MKIKRRVRTLILLSFSCIYFHLSTMRHTLSLHIPEHYNEELLLLKDTSSYAMSPLVSCERIDIIRPGTHVPISIDVQRGFDLSLNSSHLNYTEETSDFATIPDGIYHIRYSVSPNDKVFVEYYYLRTIAIENLYHNLLCKVDLAGFDPHQDVKNKLNEFKLLKMYINTAKAKVENCHELQEGVNILNYVKKILDRIGNKNNC
jgi:hypothetical protein